MKRNQYGYNLIEEGQDRWTFVVWSENEAPEKILMGTFTDVVLYAVIRLEFNLEEIDMAVKEMCANDHNAAHFGMFKTLIYTFDTEKAKKAM